MKLYHPNHSIDPAKVVWKYTLPFAAGPQVIVLPVEAKLLHTEFYESGFCSNEFALWYEVNNSEPGSLDTLQRVFQIFGTGDQMIPKMAKYVCTGVMWNEDHRNRRTDLQYVWHLYEYPNGTKILG